MNHLTLVCFIWGRKDTEIDVQSDMEIISGTFISDNRHIKAQRLKDFAFVPENSLHPVRSFLKFQWKARASHQWLIWHD